jgi:hypothetical protein
MVEAMGEKRLDWDDAAGSMGDAGVGAEVFLIGRCEAAEGVSLGCDAETIWERPSIQPSSVVLVVHAPLSFFG